MNKQDTATPYRDAALVIVGHGSTLNPDSAVPTWEHADAIRRRGLFAEVQTAFWKEEPELRRVLRTVESREVYVVPNFISEGYFTQRVIPRELELEGPITRTGDRAIYYCDPVGSHPEMTRVLLHRAAEVAPGVPPSEVSLLIVGHGTALNDNSAVAVKRQVREITALGLYGEVMAVYMEEAPLVNDWASLTRCPHVVVVPFFVADGLHSYQDIPVLLGIESEVGAALSQREVFWHNPHHLHGRSLYYASAIGTEPLFAEVILDQVAAFDAAHPEKPSLPPREGPDRIDAHLREWLETGGERLGEVAITRSGPSGFLLTHWRDGATPHDTLEPFRTPEAARSIAMYDDAGAFRPLKASPTLRRGWKLELDSFAALRRALDFLYPTALGQAAARARGALCPVPLRETLERQTGMYTVARKVTDEEAHRVITAQCGAGCQNRVLWPLAPGGAAAAPPRETAPDRFPLPCNEACNLLVAAIRTAVKERK
ncbi:MAG TPA: CbiX/SirB N-terminal domain-containing protein [Chthoniobacteraceae bacterium]|nr:CbiX/SirB N-terminal domain-containing protein [Chthoniobacteraceae bacterium]